MSSYETPVRWRDDTGWEARCGDCIKKGVAAFWPLTDEFWEKRRGMRRCRACYKAHDAKRARERYWASTTIRERRKAASRKYHQETRAAQRVKAVTKWQRIVADPVVHEQVRERQREAQARFRERRRAMKAA